MARKVEAEGLRDEMKIIKEGEKYSGKLSM